jgi:hypothetical protein
MIRQLKPAKQGDGGTMTDEEKWKAVVGKDPGVCLESHSRRDSVPSGSAKRWCAIRLPVGR